MNNLGDSDLATRLKESLSKRINQQRTKLSSLLQYLHKDNQDYTTLELDSQLNFEKITKQAIVLMLTRLYKHIDKNEAEKETEQAEEQEQEYEIQLTLKENEKLSRAINHEMKATIKSRPLKDVS